MPRFDHKVAPGDVCAGMVTPDALSRRPRFIAIHSRNLTGTLFPIQGNHYAITNTHQDLRARVWSLNWQYNDDYPREGFYNLLPAVDFHDTSPISLDCNNVLCQMAETIHNHGEVINEFRNVRVSYSSNEKITLNFPDGTQLPGQGFFIGRQYWYIQRFARHL